MGTYKPVTCDECQNKFMALQYSYQAICDKCVDKAYSKLRPPNSIRWPFVIVGMVMIVYGSILIGITIGSGSAKSIGQKCGKTPAKYPTKFESKLPAVSGGIRG